MIVRHLRPLAISLVALVLVAGSAFAVGPGSHGQPGGPGASAHPADEVEASEAPDAAPSGAVIDKIVANFEAAGITTTAEEIQKLAAVCGVGGAVRIISWAKASGKTIDEIVAMRAAGNGWGQIAKELGVSPGNGSIMSGGHGRGNGKTKP
jgi:hypothetical protein